MRYSDAGFVTRSSSLRVVRRIYDGIGRPGDDTRNALYGIGYWGYKSGKVQIAPLRRGEDRRPDDGIRIVGERIRGPLSDFPEFQAIFAGDSAAEAHSRGLGIGRLALISV